MSKIHIIPSEFNKELELQLAYSIKAGFPSPAEDYQHETLDFNRDLIKHPEATFYGRVDGDSMVEAGINDGDIAIIDRRKHGVPEPIYEVRPGGIAIIFKRQQETNHKNVEETRENEEETRENVEETWKKCGRTWKKCGRNAKKRRFDYYCFIKSTENNNK